jgi:hypothetical protein
MASSYVVEMLEASDALRGLDASITTLLHVKPERLTGDRGYIDSGILALLLIRKRIDELPIRLVAAE